MKTKLLTAGTLLLTSTALASAGGLDRATYSTSALFEAGTYAEISFGVTQPSLSPSDSAAGPGPVPAGFAYGTSMNVAEDFNSMRIRFKMDVSDSLALAFEHNDNVAGVDINYEAFASSPVPTVAGLSSLRANLRGKETSIVGKYSVTDNVSIIAGGKSKSISGSANVSVPLTAAVGAPVDGDVYLGNDTATSFVVGAAYERPEIALRIAATYETAAEFAPDVFTATGDVNTGPGQVKTPEIFLLEFQSGISEKAQLLAFGNIRHSKWEAAQVLMSAAFSNAQLSDFSDGTSYTLGIAKRFNENLVAFVSGTIDPSSCEDASLLSPTCDSKNVSLGGQYSFDSGISLAASVSKTQFGTAETTVGIPFGGNSVTTYGLRLSSSF